VGREGHDFRHRLRKEKKKKKQRKEEEKENNRDLPHPTHSRQESLKQEKGRNGKKAGHPKKEARGPKPIGGGGKKNAHPRAIYLQRGPEFSQERALSGAASQSDSRGGGKPVFTCPSRGGGVSPNRQAEQRGGGRKRSRNPLKKKAESRSLCL